MNSRLHLLILPLYLAAFPLGAFAANENANKNNNDKNSIQTFSSCEALTNPDWSVHFTERQAWLPFSPTFKSDYLMELHSKGTRGFGDWSAGLGKWQFKFISHKIEPSKIIYFSDDPSAKERLFLTVLDWFSKKPPFLENGGTGVWVQHAHSLGNTQYLVLDGAGLNALQNNPEYEAIQHLPETQMELVQNAYSKQFGKNITEDLIEISRSMKDRSIYIAKVEEPYWIFNKNGGGFRNGYQNRTQNKAQLIVDGAPPDLVQKNFNRFTIQRGEVLVLSKNNDELLPVEIETGIRIARKPGERIAEATRLVSVEGDQDKYPVRDLQFWGSIGLGLKLDRIFIYVPTERQELFNSLGFVSVNSIPFQGSPYLIMEITPQKAFETALKRDFLDLINR